MLYVRELNGACVLCLSYHRHEINKGRPVGDGTRREEAADRYVT